LWLAKRRNIVGANLLVLVPFYLASTEDPQACREPTEFLNRRLNLEIDFRDLDEKVARQNEKIARLRTLFPEIDDSIRKLESNLSLTPEEKEKLMREAKEFFRKTD
jgi:proteasome assembly chaperone (PAC2) family protein